MTVLGGSKQAHPPSLRETWPIHAIRACGATVTGTAIIALLGWLLDLPLLRGFAPDVVPMAPSTAVLFTLHGIALLMCSWPNASRRGSAAIVGFTALAAALLLAVSLLGIRSPIEHLGMRIDGEVQGIPLGHMSPVTAACFLLASLSCGLQQSLAPSRRRIAAMVAGGLLSATSVVFFLAYLYGKPLLYGSGFIPPALNTSLAFFALGVGLMLASRKAALGELPLGNRASGWLLLVFAALAVGLITMGYVFYRQQEKNHQQAVQHQLSAVADLKVGELTQWRRERLGDGEVFFGNESFVGLAQRCIEAPDDADARHRMNGWLRQVREAYSYDQVSLMNVSGAPVHSFPSTPSPSHSPAQLMEAVDPERVSFLDFHRDAPELPIHLTVLVPLRTKSSRLVGVLALRVDPSKRLYPMIRRWPTPSETAETLIVRREGSDVLFLNELRFRQGTALSFREPLSNERLPAVQAALGHTGSFEGVDYRGVEVISEMRAVPDTPWFLVARMDKSEALGPLAQPLWLMVSLVTALLAASGAALGLVWRQQTSRFYRDSYEAAVALRESEERYRGLMEHAPVAVFINRNDRVVEANLACLPLFGAQSKEELIGKSSYEMFHPDFHDAIRERIKRLRENNEVVPLMEERILRLDGTTVEVEVTAAPFMDRGERAIHVVIMDITERKEAERALREREVELRQRNDELTRFTYTVSHDLRSPLVTIQTFLGYLEKDLASQDRESVERDFGYIRGAALKMARLLDELLSLSRVGRMINLHKEVSLQAVVEEARALVAGRLASRGVELDVVEEPVFLHGDLPRLVEVFQNIIDNAVKFMGDQPHPRIEIGVESVDGETVVYVRDNGQGIDPRHTSKLFGLFEKLDPQSEGTGMGLALVSRIVEVHGGRVWAQSDGLGRGACFRIMLPGTRRGTQGEPQAN